MKNITLALAVAALILGLLGLFSGLSARREIRALEDRPQEWETVAAQAAEPGQRALQSVQHLADQTRDAVRHLQGEIQALRRDLAETGQGKAVEPAAPARPTSDRDTPARSAPAPSGRIHTVREGDTLLRIANEHGVPLQALLDVNPGIEPRRVRIGQDLQLP